MIPVDKERPAFPRLKHPLRRLIKREDASGLLAPFLSFLPGAVFVMLDQDGRLYTGTEGWDPTVMGRAWRRAQQGYLTREGQLLLRPLIIHNHLAGALLVWDKQGSTDLDNIMPLIDAVGNGFVRLLEQAVEKRDLGAELLDRYREINLLYRAAETIGASLDPDWIPRQVLDQIQLVVPADMAAVLLLNSEDENEANQSQNLKAIAWTGPVEVSQSLQVTSKELIERVLDTGESLISVPRKRRTSEGSEINNPAVVLCAPLKIHERALGILVLGRYSGNREFTAGDMKLVTALTSQAAIALETARLHLEEVKLQRLEGELSIGRQIQLSFLPESLPEISGWDFAAVYRSARQVGGDLYDFIHSPENPNRLNLVIADVTGKGIAAALFMAFTRTVLRLMSLQGGSPGSILRNVNHFILQERHSSVFTSAFFAALDLESGCIDYANAGHDWPLQRDYKTGEVRPLNATGYLLGAFEEIELDEFQTYMEPGDILVFYTDGVSEAFNPLQELYGTKRLETLIAGQDWASANTLMQAILDNVEKFTDGESQSDDLTMIVIKRLVTHNGSDEE
jgi:serine phosphatase RsbU (regulator of sigma subunit)